MNIFFPFVPSAFVPLCLSLDVFASFARKTFLVFAERDAKVYIYVFRNDEAWSGYAGTADGPWKPEGRMSIDIAKEVLKTEAGAVLRLVDRIGPEFERAEDMIARTKGRVIVSGIGKSGIVGRKIASTLSSIGIPSYFIHPVEGAHGDIGTIMRDDTALVISKSGSTDELNSILNHLKRIGVPVIAMTANPESNLAQIADVVLDISVECEACPFNIVPTASTTATLALGDALAISLLHRKGLTAEDFAMLHPGGTIGSRLTYRVGDLMVSGDDRRRRIRAPRRRGRSHERAQHRHRDRTGGLPGHHRRRSRAASPAGARLDIGAREALSATGRDAAPAGNSPSTGTPMRRR